MAAESESEVQLKIGHVLFMDVVGYSKLLVDEQREIQEELSQIVRGAQQVRAAEGAGKLIRLPTGDGMALVFFNSPEAPVYCAIDVAKKVKEHPNLKLRMGIHSGPVNEVRDVDDRINLAGAGINTAQSVMDCGDAGHILVSKHAAEDLAQSRQWRPYLHDLGSCTVKHGTPVHVVNFYAGDFGNPQFPDKSKHSRRTKIVTPNTAAKRWASIVAALVVIAVFALVVFSFLRRPSSRFTSAAVSASLPASISEKSIAVLPFENRSDEKENAYFADGVQNEILTNLAKIRDLWVISRTSVMQYKSGAPRNIREIGEQLGVAHLVEGSVQRAGNRVRVTAQLVDARSDTQQWAERYDRDLADVFAIQSEIAKAIADQLKAKLSPQEKARVEETPTANTDAYVYYLRANQISRNPDTLLEDYKTAEQLYSQAIELDSNFALAHAQLASVCAAIFHYYEPTDSWKTKARAEAEIALRLQPNLAEAHLALGQYSYWVNQDYDRALEQFAFASRLSPSNEEIPRFIAAIRRRQGKWQEALEAYERVAKLDPQNPNTVRELLQTDTAMRRWKDAAQWAQRWRKLAPDSLVAKIQSGYVDFWWKGDTQLLKSVVDQIPDGVDPDGVVSAARWDVAMLRRDYSAAKTVLQTSAANEVSYTTAGLTPKAFLEGCTYLALDDNANAKIAFESVKPAFEAALKEAPTSAERHAIVGWLYAFMGRKDDAIREGRRAVELKPESKDALDGPIMSAYLALIYARVGENNLANSLIERLLKTPGAVDSANYSITINDLKYRWEWDSLRNDPRFQKLITSP